jgi:hypothetical protein
MRNQHILAALCGLAALAAATPAAAHSRVNHRQANEQHRIAQGVRSGRLTPYEAARLERQQARIARYEHRSRADGRGLSWQERRRIERMQDRASHNIYRQKHDGQRW